MQAVTAKYINYLTFFNLDMQVRFTTKEGEFPYQAKYIGYTTPPVNIRLGIGGVSGLSKRSYGELVEAIVEDLKGCPEEIQSVFSEDIGLDLQNVTRVALELLVKYNSSQMKIKNANQILSL